jgi:hypothetical protein
MSSHRPVDFSIQCIYFYFTFYFTFYFCSSEGLFIILTLLLLYFFLPLKVNSYHVVELSFTFPFFICLVSSSSLFYFLFFFFKF